MNTEYNPKLPAKIGIVTLVVITILLWSILVVVGFIILQFGNPYKTSLELNIETISQIELEAEIKKPTRTIKSPETEVTLLSNKLVNLEESSRLSMELAGRLRGKYVYVVTVTKLAIGDTDVTIKISDSSGNQKSFTVEITRRSLNLPIGIDFDDLKPYENAEYVIVDHSDFSAVVDDTHRLLEDYEPSDLIDLNDKFYLYTLNNAELRIEAGRALKNMLDDLATQTGKYVTVASGYRSYETQLSTYTSWVSSLGKAEADKVSSRPGHSYHQLGTTVDFVSDETGWQITQDFKDTVAGKWLVDNCEIYGFSQTYPMEGSSIELEPWQFRYIGLNQ